MRPLAAVIPTHLERTRMTQHDRDEAREMAHRALDWFSSETGLKATEESESRVAKTAELLEKGRDIDSRQLHEPFTV
jgi:hypothetical protein